GWSCACYADVEQLQQCKLRQPYAERRWHPGRGLYADGHGNLRHANAFQHCIFDSELNGAKAARSSIPPRENAGSSCGYLSFCNFQAGCAPPMVVFGGSGEAIPTGEPAEIDG